MFEMNDSVIMENGFACCMGFRQCFGQDWIHFIYEGSPSGYLWESYSRFKDDKLLVSCIMWEGSMKCGVRIDAVQYPYNVPDNWKGFNVGGTNSPNHDIWGLMIPHRLRNKFQSSYVLLVEGVSMEWTLAPKGIKTLGPFLQRQLLPASTE
ncbi:hypothetical protein V8B97DRAFT_1917878 [Scleroderma yunnanense]